jgi:DNA-binding NarL/FixJ family response regulator
MAQSTRALIVDDRPTSRRGLRALLATCSTIEIVGEGTDGRQAIRLVEQLHPDVVIMDARMPVMDGLEATRCIKSRWPGVRIIVLTMYPNYRAKALNAGATAFLIKGCSLDTLIETVKT